MATFQDQSGDRPGAGSAPRGAAHKPSNSSSQPLLDVRAVSKAFPGVQALTNVSCSILPGEVHALVGQNGAGKSTLVKCITGVHPPDTGEIDFSGNRIDAFSPKHAADAGIAVVHQRMPLLPELSVAENVHLGRLPTRAGFLDRGAANRRTRELLGRFKLDVDPEAPVGSLTVSERQEVAIARALFRAAQLLVLDEPTAALDAAQSQRLFAVVENLRRENVAVLYVSHYLEEIFALADRITVLRDGRLVRTTRTSDTNETEIVTLMAGHRPSVGADVERSSLPAPDVRGAASVRLDGVSTDVLRDVSLSIDAGEVVGITGVIGAGGHEIARVLFGLTTPETGSLTLGDAPYRPHGPRDALKKGVCLVPEDPAREGMVPEMSVAANISMVDLPRFERRGFLSLRRERTTARDYVNQLGIATASVDTLVRNLSGGNQQKVLLARALAANARVLLLEEPTQGVDINAKREIHRIIRNLATEGKAAIVISTDVQDLLEFADRVIALRRGRVARDVPAADTSFAEILDVTVGADVGTAA
ncbi:MAG TPA: sugar ABC transporter ATP-binding protein [Solirubrobacteraceae bacterium]|jgi:ABC-type sugar transport system ATPase subunit|nr:sugar ABC transporter ATP-binding protein [Solirubrobacteraceae bacterium]